jgi:hypothetical protein
MPSIQRIWSGRGWFGTRRSGGTQLKTPRAVLLVDTREQNPFHFSRFEGWFTGIEKKALQLGDYSVAGLEEVCAVERKDLSDLVHSDQKLETADTAKKHLRPVVLSSTRRWCIEEW